MNSKPRHLSKQLIGAHGGDVTSVVGPGSQTHTAHPVVASSVVEDGFPLQNETQSSTGQTHSQNSTQFVSGFLLSVNSSSPHLSTQFTSAHTHSHSTQFVTALIVSMNSGPLHVRAQSTSGHASAQSQSETQPVLGWNTSVKGLPSHTVSQKGSGHLHTHTLHPAADTASASLTLPSLMQLNAHTSELYSGHWHWQIKHPASSIALMVLISPSAAHAWSHCGELNATHCEGGAVLGCPGPWVVPGPTGVPGPWVDTGPGPRVVTGPGPWVVPGPGPTGVPGR